METGIELVAKERQEQLEKHNWNKEHDMEHKEGQLKFASLYALGEKGKIQPYGWEWFQEKIDGKTEVEKLIVAGALICAEIDRLNNIHQNVEGSK